LFLTKEQLCDLFFGKERLVRLVLGGGMRRLVLGEELGALITISQMSRWVEWPGGIGDSRLGVSSPSLRRPPHSAGMGLVLVALNLSLCP
jgi:hypothetical protein